MVDTCRSICITALGTTTVYPRVEINTAALRSHFQTSVRGEKEPEGIIRPFTSVPIDARHLSVGPMDTRQAVDGKKLGPIEAREKRSHVRVRAGRNRNRERHWVASAPIDARHAECWPVDARPESGVELAGKTGIKYEMRGNHGA